VIDDQPHGWKIYLDDGSGPLLVFIATATRINVKPLRAGQQLALQSDSAARMNSIPNCCHERPATSFSKVGPADSAPGCDCDQPTTLPGRECRSLRVEQRDSARLEIDPGDYGGI
jgi:hypothetical protein